MGQSSNPPPPYRPQTTTSLQHDSPSDTVMERVDFLPGPGPILFQSNTIAPPPPPAAHPGGDGTSSTLRISTDLLPPPNHPPQRNRPFSDRSSSLDRDPSSGSLHPVGRTPSIRTALSQSLGGSTSTASSTAASPVISAMGDMTPLPSPLLAADSPGPWKQLITGTSPNTRAGPGGVGEGSAHGTTSPTGRPDHPSLSPPSANPTRRKAYPALDSSDQRAPPPPQSLTSHDQWQHRDQHGRNRSISEYVPEPVALPKRHVTVSGPRSKPQRTQAEAQEPHLRRELNLAESRGLTPAFLKPPSPPPSESSSKGSVDDGRNRSHDQGVELFEARGRHDGRRRRWRALRCLGQGTFSQVMLATSNVAAGGHGDGPAEDMPERKTLVAVKICEHGPRGGANEDRVEMSLKRELEILQGIHHPSLVDLKAFSIEPTRAILVLSYSPGGDLFDVATAHRRLLTPQLLRRLFGELVGAVQYLHSQRIVHRDIKLENVLVNLTPQELADPSMDWATFPYSITTLADLGLSRRIADDEKLETRCGSDDYAAPEVIMGQPYDGRATDAWSLGVLLYALLESRLPFDPHPGMSDAHRMRSRTSHRIARVEWRWFEYGGDDGDHESDEAKFAERGLTGALRVTEGLLKRARSRWPLGKVAEEPWVAGGVVVEGGLRFWEEQEGQVVP